MKEILKYKGAHHLYKELFDEELNYIFVSDDDPWSEEHTAKLNRRRELLGVSPISSGFD